MKATHRLFLVLFIFFAGDTVLYWYMSKDPTGTAALALAALMSGLIWYYIAFTARRIGPGPEDLEDAEIVDGAGELGFFSPYSWWPLALVLSIGSGFLGLAIGWWLVYFAIPLIAVSVVGMIFEYYMKESNRYGD